jgi:hypothetical protein
MFFRAESTFSLPSLRRLRVLGLLLALIAAVFYAAQQRFYSRSWLAPLPVTIYPIIGDELPRTRQYVAQLRDGHFSDIDRWLAREADRHGLAQITPVSTRLGESIDTLPPAFTSSSPLATLIWGLHMRLWAALHTPDALSNLGRVRIFVVYHGDPNAQLPHSLGLEKGLIGIVHAYALPEQTRQNNIVIAHELLHTVGASDKYDAYGSPVFPSGYAEPWRVPLFPQPAAEIMAGRLPLSLYESYMPAGLRHVVVGNTTAREINWLR